MKKLENEIVVIICTERGELEKQSLLFVRSLRRFGGSLNDAKIVSYSPREKYLPASETIEELKKEGVEVVLDHINSKYVKYGFGNKPQICADAEKKFKAERYLFFDSDQLILREPQFLLKEQRSDVLLLPVDKKGAGSTGFDEEADFWSDLHTKFNIHNPVKLETTVTQEEIWAYWNSGLISLRGGQNIFSSWNQIFQEMMDSELWPQGQIMFTEQVSFSITVQSLGLKVMQLPKGYNYPVENHNQLALSNKISDISEAATLHYHRSFRTPSKKGKGLYTVIEKHPESEWFMEQFKALNLYPRPMDYTFSFYKTMVLNGIKRRLSVNA